MDSREVRVTAAAGVWQKYFTHANPYVLERLRAALDKEQTSLSFELPVAESNEGWVAYYRRAFAQWCVIFRVPPASQPPDFMQMEDWKRAHSLAAQHPYTPAEATEAIIHGIRLCTATWESRGVALVVSTRRLTEQEVLEAQNTRGRLRSRRGAQNIHVVHVSLSWELAEEEDEAGEAGEAGEGEQGAAEAVASEGAAFGSPSGLASAAKPGAERIPNEAPEEGGSSAPTSDPSPVPATATPATSSRWARMRSASPPPSSSFSRHRVVDVDAQVAEEAQGGAGEKADGGTNGAAAGAGAASAPSWPPEPAAVPEPGAGLPGSELERMVYRVHESIKVLHRERDLATYEMRRAKMRMQQSEAAQRKMEAEVDALRLRAEQARLDAEALREQLLEAKQQHLVLEEARRRSEAAMMQAHAQTEARIAAARAAAEASGNELRAAHEREARQQSEAHAATLLEVRSKSQAMLDEAHTKFAAAARERAHAVEELRKTQAALKQEAEARAEACRVSEEAVAARGEAERQARTLSEELTRTSEEAGRARAEVARVTALCRVMETETEAHSARVVELGKQRALLKDQVGQLRDRVAELEAAAAVAATASRVAREEAEEKEPPSAPATPPPRQLLQEADGVAAEGFSEWTPKAAAEGAEAEAKEAEAAS
jgi:hypothetical protein